TSWADGARLHYGRFARVLVLMAGGVWVIGLIARDQRPTSALRNFYGLYGIWNYDRGRDDDGVERSVRLLSHNGTNHGLQSRRRDERCVATGYFHRQSPLGELLLPMPSPRRAAVIGLGAGTIATYFTAADQLTFYELDADTVTLAHRHFDFLDRCGAKPRVVLGDARIELGRDPQQPDHGLDVLIVDAFSGDAIPFHLLTREAQALYLRKLSPHGRLIFHVSSRFYELWPTIASTARQLGLYSAQRVRVESRALGPLAWSSQYLVASRDRSTIDALAARGWIPTTQSGARAFTDDRASLLGPLLGRLWH
ncbi:MAG: fused MFS/spermidine synthase, partial [Polyangiales bacterium]